MCRQSCVGAKLSMKAVAATVESATEVAKVGRWCSFLTNIPIYKQRSILYFLLLHNSVHFVAYFCAGPILAGSRQISYPGNAEATAYALTC